MKEIITLFTGKYGLTRPEVMAEMETVFSLILSRWYGMDVMAHFREKNMWIFRGGDPKKTALIYQYHPTRSGDVAAAFLRGYTGYVQTDGYSGYDFLDSERDIEHLGCWAHARRKFKDVVKAQGKKRKKTGSADVALSYIGRLYRIEKEAQKKNLSPEEIHRERQDKSQPVLEEFRQWLLKRSSQTPPKGLLGKAISYTLRQWDRLVGYLQDGRLSMDNNAAENSIRPFVVGISGTSIRLGNLGDVHKIIKMSG